MEVTSYKTAFIFENSVKLLCYLTLFLSTKVKRKGFFKTNTSENILFTIEISFRSVSLLFRGTFYTQFILHFNEYLSKYIKIWNKKVKDVKQK